jgi:hypothetical protein
MIWRVVREPLAHFVLAGALLFTAYGFAGSERPAGSKIVVGPADIESLVGEWRQQWGRAPTRDELDKLVQSHVREQVLYREALELGLDRNDTIVRRRMLQKMEFLGAAVAADDEPPLAELERFFLAGADRYRVPAKASFTHVYFSRDRRGPRAADDARSALPALRSPANDDGETVPLGDPFLLGTDHGAQTRQSLEALFGASFARAVFESEVNIWQGPIESAYGFHLVRVKERTEDRLPPVAEVRAQVLADWRQVRRQGANLDLYSKLRRRYQVEVDQSALAAVMHRK